MNTVPWITGPDVFFGQMFRDYFDSKDLCKSRLVCRKWNNIILSPMVGLPKMIGDNIPFVQGENWWTTFFKRKVVIAVDCSGSMTMVPEQWKYDVAVGEAKAITTRIKHFAQEKGIRLYLFGTSSTQTVIHSTEEIDNQLAENAGKVGSGNNWELILDQLHFEVSSVFKTSVFILSDSDLGITILGHKILKEGSLCPADIYLCCLGSAYLDKRIMDKLRFPHSEAEPIRKKFRSMYFSPNSYSKIITEENGTDGDYNLLRPSVSVLPPGEPLPPEPIIEEMDENDDSLTPTDIESYDVEYFPPEDYQDSDSDRF
jgi:hypothetical protein